MRYCKYCNTLLSCSENPGIYWSKCDICNVDFYMDDNNINIIIFDINPGLTNYVRLDFRSKDCVVVKKFTTFLHLKYIPDLSPLTVKDFYNKIFNLKSFL